MRMLAGIFFFLVFVTDGVVPESCAGRTPFPYDRHESREDFEKRMEWWRKLALPTNRCTLSGCTDQPANVIDDPHGRRTKLAFSSNQFISGSAEVGAAVKLHMEAQRI